MENSRSSRGIRAGISNAKRSWRGERIGLLGAFREIILGILSGVIPWWFGANDPPAIHFISSLILLLGIVTLLESLIQNRCSNLSWSQILLTPPVVFLGFLCVFGFIQWVVIDAELLQLLSPKRFMNWKELGGETQLITPGDDTVYRIPPRIAWLDAEVYESVVWVASLWVLMICVIRLPGRWGPLKRHSLVMVVSGLLMGIQSMLQAMTFTGKVLWVRQAQVVISSAGPFFVHSHLAAYLNIGLGFTLAHLGFMAWKPGREKDQEHLFHDQRSGLGKGVFWIYAAGFILVSVFASGSRGGMLAMIMACAALGTVWVVCARKLRKISAGTVEWKWIIGLMIASVFFLTLFTDVLAVFSRARGLVGKEGGHAAGIRQRVWAVAWETWKDAPIWGTGWGSYLWASQRHFNSAVGYSTHAESDYVQALTEGGVIGVILIIAILAGFMRCMVQLIRKVEHPQQMALAGGGIFAITAVAWGSLTENNLRTAGVAIPSLITAAHLVRLSAGWSWFESKEWDDQSTLRNLGVSQKFAGIFIGILLVSLAWAGQAQTQKVRQAWDLLRQADLRPAGTDLRGWIQPSVKTETLQQQRSVLEIVSRILPGWGDYGIQQAVTEVEIYERQTRETLIKEGASAEDAEKLSRMIQLGVVMKSLPAAERTAARLEILRDPVVGSELRKTMGFLAKAWQNQSISAMVHSELALLDWAFEKGHASEDSLKRALSLVGQRQDLLLRIGQEAIALGHHETGLKAFVRVLSIPDRNVEKVSAQILPWLTPEEIDMLADQPAIVAIRAGELLVPDSETRRRQRFGEKALAGLPSVKSATDAGIIELIARAEWLKGDREKAIEQIKLATAYDRDGFEIRERLIDWLIATGKTSEALEQTQVMRYLWPTDTRIGPIMDKAVSADARGPVKQPVKVP